jgi:PKD repeat protein
LVNGSVTSANCQVKLTTPPAPVKPSLACVQLTASPVDKSTTDYNFTAQASAVNTTITGYNFNFGDNSTPTQVESNSTSVSTGHTYATPGTYTASVTVTGSNNQTATSKACEVSINIPTPPTTPPVTPPVQLVNTGPGDLFGIVGMVTVLGAIAHNLFMRRFAELKSLTDCS